jgi:hypothetical protein
MNISNKDKAIAWGVKDEYTVNKFKKKLVEMPNGCIEYSGCFWDNRKLYRGFSVNKSNKRNGEYSTVLVKAHRFSYALTYGIDALPRSKKFTGDSKIINHICHNKSCVNVQHLNILTSRENTNVENRKPNDKNLR